MTVRLPPQHTRIGVVGASARAAVMSLARAGYSAWAIDLFNDRDLRRIAPCVRCPLESFPQAIPVLATAFAPGPALYTGGLENAPDVVADLARTREVLGTGPDALRRVRDPFALPFRPEARPTGERVPGDSRWLIKSLRSAGGLGVRDAVPGEAVPAGHVAERFITGPVHSAVFQDGELLGVTEQLVGTGWLHARPYHYAGSIVEPHSAASASEHLQKLGTTLTSEFGLVGYFGIDFIPGDGPPVLLEVNPRYPASLEAIEFANRLRLTVGKAIYFAPHALTFPTFGPWHGDLSSRFDPWKLPDYADIPDAGEWFDAGSPVLTYFAVDDTAEACQWRLQSQAAILDRLFAGHAK